MGENTEKRPRCPRCGAEVMESDYACPRCAQVLAPRKKEETPSDPDA